MIGTANAQRSGSVCTGDVNTFLQALEQDYHETVIWESISENARQVWIVTANVNGHGWTILLRTLRPDITCVVGSGKGYITHLIKSGIEV
jgi:hypothetical protein